MAETSGLTQAGHDGDLSLPMEASLRGGVFSVEVHELISERSLTPIPDFLANTRTCVRKCH